MHGKGAGKGSLLAALAEAAFLIGAEKNRYLSFLRICIKQHISTLYVKVNKDNKDKTSKRGKFMV